MILSPFLLSPSLSLSLSLPPSLSLPVSLSPCLFFRACVRVYVLLVMSVRACACVRACVRACARVCRYSKLLYTEYTYA